MSRSEDEDQIRLDGEHADCPGPLGYAPARNTRLPLMQNRLIKLINDGLAFASISRARLRIAPVHTSSSLFSLSRGHTRSLSRSSPAGP